MPPLLLQQIYDQIKRVFNKKIALADDRGEAYQGFDDFDKKNFTLTKHIRPDLYAISVEDEDKLQAIPIYNEDKFQILVVTEMEPEDAQSIQVLNSLVQLITQQFYEQNRPKPDTIDLLFNRLVFKPYSVEPEELRNHLSILGYNIGMKVAMLVELKGFWDHYLHELGESTDDKGNLILTKKQEIDRALLNFFSRDNENIVGYVGGDLFLLLKDIKATGYNRFLDLFRKNYSSVIASLKNIHIKEVTVGIGRAAQSAPHLIMSCHEAYQTMQIGKKIKGEDQVFSVEDLGILPLILDGDASKKIDFSQKYLSLLDLELITTLETFFKYDLNLTETAKQLKVHRNTVIYRLDRICEVTGKDPRSFEDALELYLATVYSKAIDQSAIPTLLTQNT